VIDPSPRSQRISASLKTALGDGSTRLAAFLADYPINQGDFDAATLAGRTRRSPLRTRPLIRSRPGRHDARRGLAAAACEEAGL
jgi:hypothetical protein